MTRSWTTLLVRFLLYCQPFPVLIVPPGEVPTAELEVPGHHGAEYSGQCCPEQHIETMEDLGGVQFHAINTMR